MPFAAGQGLFVPAGTWHAVANTGAEDVIMVFGFPHPDYPPTERKDADGVTLPASGRGAADRRGVGA